MVYEMSDILLELWKQKAVYLFPRIYQHVHTLIEVLFCR